MQGTRKWYVRRGDGALSDVVGTMILLGVTLSLVTVAALGLSATQDDDGGPLPKLTLSMSASRNTAGDVVLTLVHAGGGTFARDDLKLVVVSQSGDLLTPEDKDLLSDHTLTPGVTKFRLGDSIDIPLPGTPVTVIPDGGRLEIGIVSVSRGGVISAGFATVPEDASSTILRLTIQTPVDSQRFGAGDTVALSAKLEGNVLRTSVIGVTVNLEHLGGPNAWALSDDGTRGDAIAGDLTFQSYFLVPDFVDAGPDLDDAGGAGCDADLDFIALVAGELPVLSTVTVLCDKADGPATLPRVEITDFFPKFVGPLHPVIVNGTNFTFVNQATLVRVTDQVIHTAVWAPGNDRDRQLVLVAPPNDNPDDENYVIHLFTPYGSASKGTLKVAGTICMSDPACAPVNNGLNGLNGAPGSPGSGSTVIINNNGGGGGSSASYYNNTTVFQPGTAGLNGPPGTQGPPGADGTFNNCVVGAAPPLGCSVPTVSSMSPTTATPGTAVTLTGTGFSEVRSVTIGREGTSEIHNTIWGLDSATPDTRLFFTVPNVATAEDRQWVVTAVTSNAYDTAPGYLTITFPQPVITSLSPSVGGPYTQVIATGSHFSGARSVSLGGISVPWTPIDDQTIAFSTHPGLTPSGVSVSYPITVANALKTGTSSAQFLALPTTSGGGTNTIISNTFYNNGTVNTTTITTGAGPQGPPGQNGVSPGGDASKGIPEITAISPKIGGPGTSVTLTGKNLSNVSSVFLAVEGSTLGYGTIWFPDTSAPAGTKLGFLAPDITEADYVVTVVTAHGTFGNAPDVFSLTLPQPRIDQIITQDPIGAYPYTQVTIRGVNFTNIKLVTISNESYGSYAVPWTVTSDAQIVFTSLPGLVPGQYNVTVSNGAKSDTETYGLVVLAPLTPTDLQLDPPRADVGQQVNILGTNLQIAARVTLTDPLRDLVFAPSYWLNGTKVTFIVPEEAAPPATDDITYTVRLYDSTGNIAPDEPQLIVNHIPPPSLTVPGFTPARGTPFTQVTLTGTNFINVESVTFGDVPVYFAVASPTKITAITHGGLGPGFYHITVKTATGQATTVNKFQALPPILHPVYDKDIFEYVAVNTSITDSTNDQVNVTVKLKFKQAGWSVVLSNAGNVVCGDVATLWCYPAVGNSAPKSAEFVAASAPNGCSKATTTVGQTVVLTTGSPGPSIIGYDSTLSTFRFYVSLKVQPPAGSAFGSAAFLTTVLTDDLSQYFVVPANTPNVEVKDGVHPINGFWNCN